MQEFNKPVPIDLGDVFPDFGGIFQLRPWETIGESERIEAAALARLHRAGLLGDPASLPIYVRNNGFIIATVQVLGAEVPQWFQRIDSLPRTPALQGALELLWSRLEAAREDQRKKNPGIGRPDSSA